MVGESEIEDAGYTDLAIGQLIVTNWPYIEFRDGSSNIITRIPNDLSDTRLTRTIVAKKVDYTIAFTGADTDIAAFMAAHSGSVTFQTCVFKKLDTDGATVMASDAFTPATLSTAGDTLTVTVSAGVLT